MESIPVIIVGGGPVGLASALELARHGVRSLLVERHDSTTWHPKARNLNTRTMEVSRGWGKDVHDGLVAVNLPSAWTSQIIYTRTLGGEELGRMPTTGFSGPGRRVSPEIPLLSSQDIFEPIMRRGAAATGLAELRFGHEAGRILHGAADEDESVALEVTERATGRTYEVEAEYLIAADGSMSEIRAQLGIGLMGPQGLGHFINVYYRANLDPWTAHRPAILYWVVSDMVRGVFQPLDAKGRWLCQIAYDGTSLSYEEYTPERCIEWIRAAVGDDDLTPEILSIGTWTMNAAVADRLVSGRVILAGDAAHQLPPTGGFGVNTGIQGAHNLAWKLAFVMRGAAQRSLIDTYEVERSAVGEANAKRSLENSQMVGRINDAAAKLRRSSQMASEAVAASKRYGNFLGMELGFWYESSAVVADGTEPPSPHDPVTDYVPCARPGHRAPHVELGPDGETRSTLDLFGTDFTLLLGPAGDGWRVAADDAASHHGIDIDVYAIGAGGTFDPHGYFLETYGIGPGGAVLVRPDGHVAWRSRGPLSGAQRQLSDALSQVLSRTRINS